MSELPLYIVSCVFFACGVWSLLRGKGIKKALGYVWLAGGLFLLVMSISSTWATWRYADNLKGIRSPDIARIRSIEILPGGDDPQDYKLRKSLVSSPIHVVDKAQIEEIMGLLSVAKQFNPNHPIAFGIAYCVWIMVIANATAKLVLIPAKRMGV